MGADKTSARALMEGYHMAIKSREQMDNETALAKSVDILYVARNYGIELKKCGTCYKDKSDKGLVFFPRTNSFFDYYQNLGGSTIDFVMYMDGREFKEAVEYLNDISGNSRNDESVYDKGKNEAENSVNDWQKKTDSNELIMPIANDTYKRVFAYLVNARSIAPSVVSQMMREKKLYESRDRHNAVFVAYDEKGNPKHAFLRGTISDKVWRGDAFGSDKNYGFSVTGKNDELIVFEAPIDALSYMTIKKGSDSHLLALGMLSPEPIDTYLSEHSEIKRISFSLDVDIPGLSATQKFAEEYKAKGYDCSNNDIVLELMKSGCKDVNEYCCKLSGKENRDRETDTATKEVYSNRRTHHR